MPQRRWGSFAEPCGPSMECLARQFWVIDPQGQAVRRRGSGLGGLRGGAGWYKNIISHEYVSIPLVRWFYKAFEFRNVGLLCQCYLDKLSVLLLTLIIWINMYPPLLPNRNLIFWCRDRLFITLECTCISWLWRDASILLPALQRNDHPQPIIGSPILTFLLSMMFFDKPKRFGMPKYI